MTVVHPEEGTTRPVGGLFELGLYYVENYRYSIFIIVPDDSLMRIRSIGHDHSISLTSKLGWLIAGQETD